MVTSYSKENLYHDLFFFLSPSDNLNIWNNISVLLNVQFIRDFTRDFVCKVSSTTY